MNGAALGVKEPGLRPDDRDSERRWDRDPSVRRRGDGRRDGAERQGARCDRPAARHRGAAPGFPSLPREWGARLLELGVGRPATLESPTRAKDRRLYQRVLENAGVKGVTPGMTLSINGGARCGMPVPWIGGGSGASLIVFEGQGSRANVTVQLTQYQRAKFTIGETQQGLQPHLLGMTGVATVAKSGRPASQAGIAAEMSL